MAATHEFFRQMGTDETGAAGNQIGRHSVEGYGKGRSNEFLTVVLFKRGIWPSLSAAGTTRSRTRVRPHAAALRLIRRSPASNSLRMA